MYLCQNIGLDGMYYPSVTCREYANTKDYLCI